MTDMKGRFVHFSSTSIQHVYQRAVDHGVIFYTLEDRLVYYTLYASKAMKYKVKVCAAAIMFTHTHQSCIAKSLEILRRYLHDAGTSFSRLYNAEHGRKGKLLERRPGISQKSSSKSKRSNIIYVFNNHVEKGLCKSASEERWSFLAYAESDHPFSRKIDIRMCSDALRKAMKLVNKRVLKMKSLEYRDLHKIRESLPNYEYEQFIDYVISKYSWVDFSISSLEFGSMGMLKTAADSTTGNEYDIKEDFSNHTDVAYITLSRYSAHENILKDIYSMSEKKKNRLAVILSRKFAIPDEQIKAFLHWGTSSN